MKIFKLIPCALLLAVVLVSCSKEQKIRKNLSGTWKITSTTDDSMTASMALGVSYQYQFSDCKKKDEPCNGVYTISYNLLGFPISISANFNWQVSESILTITPVDSTMDAASYKIDFPNSHQFTATTNNNPLVIYTLDEL